MHFLFCCCFPFASRRMNSPLPNPGEALSALDPAKRQLVWFGLHLLLWLEVRTTSGTAGCGGIYLSHSILPTKKRRNTWSRLCLFHDTPSCRARVQVREFGDNGKSGEWLLLLLRKEELILLSSKFNCSAVERAKSFESLLQALSRALRQQIVCKTAHKKRHMRPSTKSKAGKRVKMG